MTPSTGSAKAPRPGPSTTKVITTVRPRFALSQPKPRSAFVAVAFKGPSGAFSGTPVSGSTEMTPVVEGRTVCQGLAETAAGAGVSQAGVEVRPA